MTQARPVLTPADAGCWFDCRRGFYIGEAVIEMAIDYGFYVSDWRAEDLTADGEWYFEVWDDAQRFLADLAPEGYWVGALESGDFGMWACDEEED